MENPLVGAGTLDEEGTDTEADAEIEPDPDADAEPDDADIDGKGDEPDGPIDKLSVSIEDDPEEVEGSEDPPLELGEAEAEAPEEADPDCD